MVKVGLINMIDKKFLAVTVGAIFVLGMYGPNVAEIIQSAEAHGVQHNFQVVLFKLQMKQFHDSH